MHSPCRLLRTPPHPRGSTCPAGTFAPAARNHNHFHKMLHKRLHGILESTQPTKSVMIAVDGPAPLAKLLTQRERRKVGGLGAGSVARLG